MRDYNKYQFSLSQMTLWLLCDSAAMFAMGYLFFKSIVLAAAALIAVPFFVKLQKARSVTRQKRKLLETFRMFICSLSAAMSGTGTSVERAVREAHSELSQMCPSGDCFVSELENILMTVDNNRAKCIENEFETFALRTGLQDIIDFGGRKNLHELLMILQLYLFQLEFTVITLLNSLTATGFIRRLDVTEAALLVKQNTLLLLHFPINWEESLCLLGRESGFSRDELLHISLKLLGVKLRHLPELS